MKTFFSILTIIMISFIFSSCNTDKGLTYKDPDAKIIFLHHSTGLNVWKGGAGMDNPLLIQKLKKYNLENNKKYAIKEQVFPKSKPYGWNNYPYDYYNIWVKNAGNKEYMKEPTLEILTKEYNVIVFKHCFPVSEVLKDIGEPDINSSIKRLENYKLQYNALKEKLKQFPNTKFIVWTAASLTQATNTEENAVRAKAFVDWVRNEWDQDGDNIFLFDFWQIETEGDIYLKGNYAVKASDSHPNTIVSKKASGLLSKRIIDVIENNGQKTLLTGEDK